MANACWTVLYKYWNDTYTSSILARNICTIGYLIIIHENPSKKHPLSKKCKALFYGTPFLAFRALIHRFTSPTP